MSLGPTWRGARYHLLAWGIGGFLAWQGTATSLVLHGHGYSLAATGGSAGVFHLTQGTGAILGGLLARRWHPRAVLLASLALVLVASLSMPLVLESIVGLLTARFAQGLALGSMIVCGQAGLSREVPAQDLGRATTFYTIWFGLGMALSPLVAGPSTDLLGELAIPMGILFLAALLPSLLGSAGGEAGGEARGGERRAEFPWVTTLPGLLAAAACGAVEGTILSLYPAFLRQSGIASGQTGIPMTVYLVGGGVGLAILGLIRRGVPRRRDLAGLSLLGAVVALVAGSSRGLPAAVLSAGAVGMVFGPLFPATLGWLMGRPGASDGAMAAGFFTFSFHAGCALGPWSAGMMAGTGCAFGLFSAACLLSAFSALLFVVPRIVSRTARSSIS